MDTPEGFDAWSEECKERFRKLKREWDEREAAARTRDQTVATAEAADVAADAAEAAQDAAEAELAAIQDRAKNYGTNRQTKRQERDAAKATEAEALRALQRSLTSEVKRGTKPFDEAREEFQAQEAAATARVATLKTAYENCKNAYDELRRQKARDRVRSRELEGQAGQRQRALDAAEAAKEVADRAAAAAARALAGLRSADQLREDYFKTIRECGPQDPKPGGASIPVPIGLVAPDDEPISFEQEQSEVAIFGRGAGLYGGPGGVRLEGENQWQDDLTAYLLTMAPQHSLAFHQNRLAVRDAGYERSDVLAEHEPQEGFVPWDARKEQLCENGLEEVALAPARNWHAGCIEFLWVEGPTPEVDGRAVSNPITRTVSKAMGDVNRIFAGCCVRFTAHLKVVTMKQLEGLDSATDGISVKGGTTKSVSKEKIHPNLGAFIKNMQDHPDCASFLVVDEIDGGAGFAGLGTRRGIVTMASAGKDRLGDTTAHELGHAVGGIAHVVNEGKPNERKHAHGELMWGKGCEGHPRPKHMRYATVTATDCAQMRANTADTGEECKNQDA